MSTSAEDLTDHTEQPVARNLAEIVDYIDADSNLSARRKRDLRSALKTIVEALGRGDLDRVAADWRQLAKPLSAIHPARLGLTKKRWQNVVSDLKFAIRHVNGRLATVPRQRTPLGPVWSRLRDRIKDPAIHRGLSRFMGYCDAERIAPEAVNDQVSGRYLAHLEEVSYSKSPTTIHRATCSMWNRAVHEVFGLAPAASDGPKLPQTGLDLALGLFSGVFSGGRQRIPRLARWQRPDNPRSSGLHL